MIGGVLLDLSGVLYVGSNALPGAHTALQRLRDSGLPLRYVTNTTRSPRTAILRQLAAMGFEIGTEQLFTAPDAARRYLRAHQLRPVLLIHRNLHPEFADFANQSPNAVLVGDAGEDFDYAHLNAAFRILAAGGELVAMGRNRYFQEQDGLSLDAGPFVCALEYGADVRAVVTGKPAADFFQTAVAELGCTAGETVMVGDDVEGDVLGAIDAGLQAALVRTGKFRDGDETRLRDTGAKVFADLSAVVDWILSQAGR